MKFKTFRALVITGGALVVGLLIFSAVRCANNREPAPTPGVAGSKPPPSATAGDYREELSITLGQQSFGETKIKDWYKGRGVKVNLYADGDVWNRAKVDLDRDDRWDEKWRIEDGVVYRAIAANDDENYGPEEVVKGGAAPTSAPVPAAPETAGELREVDSLMLELLNQPVQAKIKDASKGRPFKINLYSDDGQRFNRAKVDLDRDDKWDEKWTFRPDGKTEREVAPADDENYTERFVLEAGVRWQAI